MIDSRAVISNRARLESDVTVGPFSVIGDDVEIESGTIVGPHVVIQGPTRIGKNNKIYQFSSIGEDPQDKKYAGERTELIIGDGNTIREFVTINRGTVQGGGVTKIGDDNWLMASIHIAHDCLLGNGIVMANYAGLAGHVVIEDYVIMGGYSGVHQFCRVGAYSFLARGSVCLKDVPPYICVSGNPSEPRGLNQEGLKRHQFSSDQISMLKKAYKLLYRSKLRLDEANKALADLAPQSSEVQRLVEFLGASSRSIVR